MALNTRQTPLIAPLESSTTSVVLSNDAFRPKVEFGLKQSPLISFKNALIYADSLQTLPSIFLALLHLLQVVFFRIHWQTGDEGQPGGGGRTLDPAH